ncbi:hypothetical protein CA233_00765 [Sphingomonas sp. ABOLD]|nr:hypothetical protein CA233_00765 [Sphingomonas sp. ABOLD]
MPHPSQGGPCGTAGDATRRARRAAPTPSPAATAAPPGPARATAAPAPPRGGCAARQSRCGAAPRRSPGGDSRAAAAPRAGSCT